MPALESVCSIMLFHIASNIVFYSCADTFGFMLRVKVRRVCRSLPIENDERVEQTSLIPIELIRPDDLNSRIMLGGPGMITILDDPSDGKKENHTVRYHNLHCCRCIVIVLFCSL